jgi:myo-inositol 2-dehydrogenase / D-chiro-inositol 1-dehydrogenase
MEIEKIPQGEGGRLTRRGFVKTTATATAGLTALMASGNFAYARPNETLRVGLVGCGGRGKGAARDAVVAAEGVELVAMGDLFEDRLTQGIQDMQTVLGDRYAVTSDRAFAGWDAYRNVIDSDVDYVVLATPTVFRPEHLRYAVEAGKHVFMEKPVAVDPPGCRLIMEVSDEAQQKGLGIVAGTQRRHAQHYIEAMQRIHDGEIGEVVAGQVFWNQDGLWMHPRQPEWSDVEWQLRNWIYFTHLAGDIIIEQHIHQIDVANWALQTHPIRAVAVGGRQARTGEEYGNVYDHFAVDFHYPNGARVLSMCRQQDGTARRIEEQFVGTKGYSNQSFTYAWIRGENPWEFEGQNPNPYVQEHVNLINSIRQGRPLNEGRRMAETNLTGIMGREAAYTGGEITWDEIYNSSQDLTPKEWSFGDFETPPVAIPGVTRLDRQLFAEAR